MEDMDVLIGRIEARIKGCNDVIKGTMPESAKEYARNRIDAFQDVLKDVGEITKSADS